MALRDAVEERTSLTAYQERVLLETAEVFPTSFALAGIARLKPGELSAGQIAALRHLAGQAFRYRWQVVDALAAASPEWRRRSDSTINKLFNKGIEQKLDIVFQEFGVPEQTEETAGLKTSGLQQRAWSGGMGNGGMEEYGTPG